MSGVGGLERAQACSRWPWGLSRPPLSQSCPAPQPGKGRGTVLLGAGTPGEAAEPGLARPLCPWQWPWQTQQVTCAVVGRPHKWERLKWCPRRCGAAPWWGLSPSLQVAAGTPRPPRWLLPTGHVLATRGRAGPDACCFLGPISPGCLHGKGPQGQRLVPGRASGALGLRTAPTSVPGRRRHRSEGCAQVCDPSTSGVRTAGPQVGPTLPA